MSETSDKSALHTPYMPQQAPEVDTAAEPHAGGEASQDGKQREEDVCTIYRQYRDHHEVRRRLDAVRNRDAQLASVDASAAEYVVKAGDYFPMLKKHPSEARALGALIDRGLGLYRDTSCVVTPAERESALIDLAYAFEHMFMANQRLVFNMAHRYEHVMPYEELVQYGNIGLMTAVARFEQEKGYEFSTYAAHWINREMQIGVEKTARTIRLPRRVHETRLSMGRAERELYAELDRDPTIAEIANKAGVDIDTATELMLIGQLSLPSLNKKVYMGNGEDGDELGDILVLPDKGEEIEQSLRDMAAKQDIRRLMCVAELSAEEKFLVGLRYGVTMEQFNDGQVTIPNDGSSEEPEMLLFTEVVAELEKKGIDVSEGIAPKDLVHITKLGKFAVYSRIKSAIGKLQYAATFLEAC